MRAHPPSSLDRDPLECLRQAGRVAAEAREAGARVREVCVAVEEAIARRGAGQAFPVQSSRNAVAAHDCPSPDDGTRYAEGDLAKLDIGVEVDGWVVDTALTVNVGDRPEHRRFRWRATRRGRRTCPREAQTDQAARIPP